MKSKQITVHDLDGSEKAIKLTEEVVASYSLEKWAQNFTLMTAGYRDQLDPDDAGNPGVAINLVTVAILGEAKARVFKRKKAGIGGLHVHIGGETRPHTQEFIRLLARVYAAHGFKVHLRAKIPTTPIWYSSFGVFYEGFQSGDNLTASHSQYFKGGWKPMDSLGKQLVEEEKEIIQEVQHIISSRATIKLTSLSDENIFHDFDVDDAYVNYQKSVIDRQSILEIQKAHERGFCCAICTVGGSMKLTSERLFQRLDISVGKNNIVQYFFEEEDSEYHKIGQINGKNHGVDPTKREIYRNIGAQDKLLQNKASVVFIWDPDGDRFNMVTTAPAENSRKYEDLGLEVEKRKGEERCIVYFTPNQIFFMLTAFQIAALKKTGAFDSYDWFIASSVTTSRALDELAELEKIPIVHVRVGFKHWGTFAEWLEDRKDENESYITALGEEIKLGKKPRLILMCEESGGAIFGGKEFLKNRSASRELIAMREKDAFQFGLLTLSLGAFLYNSDQSFADYYCNLIQKHNIRNKYFSRCDKTLYDESLLGVERQQAKKAGEARRDKIMQYFHELAEKYTAGMLLKEISDEIHSRLEDRSQPFPELKHICLIGKGTLLEGTFLQFESFWFVIRASGTDAVLRYYINGEDKEEIEACQEALINIKL
jgi:phosphomannomutase